MVHFEPFIAEMHAGCCLPASAKPVRQSAAKTASVLSSSMPALWKSAQYKNEVGPRSVVRSATLRMRAVVVDVVKTADSMLRRIPWLSLGL